MKLSLLYPEWQSYGENADVYHGALEVGEALFDPDTFVKVDVPLEEALEKTTGVLGLKSIAPRFQRTIRDIRKRAPSKIFTVGGTCGVEVAPVGYLNERYNGNLGVIWLDAHGDLNTPASSPSGQFHGMALRTLLGDGPEEYTSELKLTLLSKQIFLVGTRELDPPERIFIDQAEISVTLTEQFSSPEILVNRIKTAGLENVYIHLDLDVLDPNSFPNSLMRTPEGPSLDEVQNLIRVLAESFNVVGFSVVEYCAHQEDNSLGKLRDLVNNCGITL